jgi:uncharacterized protein (DUF488 family)
MAIRPRVISGGRLPGRPQHTAERGGAPPVAPPTIFTIGHSTRALGQLVALLHKNDIQLLADVRTAPGSRRLPHFNRLDLERTLAADGIRYVHLPELGGLRKPRADSPNAGWHNSSFRGYADYMQEPTFWEALDGLVALAEHSTVAIMCAEAVPWRCHRNLIADALTVRRLEVRHIIGDAQPRVHRLNSMATVNAERITYPASPSLVEEGQL